MPRALFEKKGRAVWISHLDLMRLFQRAFKRANLHLTHTQGYNQRPSVSIALPLSVGVESNCELIDFNLEGQQIDSQQICDRLNDALVDGIRVLTVYDNGRKLRELALLSCKVYLIYDNGVPQQAQEAIAQLFSRESVIAPKKTKSGIQDQDLIPMIRRISVEQVDDKRLCLNALVCCQNPTLNPAQLILAIGMYLPQFKPDHSVCERIEVYDMKENIFR